MHFKIELLTYKYVCEMEMKEKFVYNYLTKVDENLMETNENHIEQTKEPFEAKVFQK